MDYSMVRDKMKGLYLEATYSLQCIYTILLIFANFHSIS
jgi:hypothetical protein